MFSWLPSFNDIKMFFFMSGFGVFSFLSLLSVSNSSFLCPISDWFPLLFTYYLSILDSSRYIELSRCIDWIESPFVTRSHTCIKLMGLPPTACSSDFNFPTVFTIFFFSLDELFRHALSCMSYTCCSAVLMCVTGFLWLLGAASCWRCWRTPSASFCLCAWCPTLILNSEGAASRTYPFILASFYLRIDKFDGSTLTSGEHSKLLSSCMTGDRSSLDYSCGPLSY